MTGALKSTRTEHQPLLSSEGGNLRLQSHGFPPDRTDFFETHLDAEERKRLEHSLLRKLDRRMSILVLIYILNRKCLVLSFAEFTRCISDIDRNNVS